VISTGVSIRAPFPRRAARSPDYRQPTGHSSRLECNDSHSNAPRGDGA
jgi:hypothetical protein